ncbi:MAG: hypothetical protein IPK18_00470 [Sphingobacteriales bacterium]|nr:MAG: hypothetical protein IPK18_00470 [Sphingobacteriales bacterium]
MLLTLKYLIIFIIGYKLVKLLLPQPKVATAQQNKHATYNEQKQNIPQTDSKYKDAEYIDFEEIK